MISDFVVALSDWPAACAEASRIRETVFVTEQGVPADLEMDAWDAPSTHALAWPLGRIGRPGAALGTARLLPDGHIGRMAVLAPWRGRGIGQALLGQMIGQARLRGDREVLLNAQTAALGFYAKLGFQAFGEIFLDAGIPHRAMRLRLG